MTERRYEIAFIPAAGRELKKLPTKEQRLIRDAILALADNPRPHGCTKLTGREAYRIRVGDYRVIYEISDRKVLVTVFRIGHRREVYKD